MTDRAVFIVKLRFQCGYAPPVLDAIRRGIGNFFCYLEALQRRGMRRTTRLSLLLVVLGAAWVAFWETVVTFLIQFPGDRLRLYRRVGAAEVKFVCPAPEPTAVAAPTLADARSYSGDR